jgi:hypothetical protein
MLKPKLSVNQVQTLASQRLLGMVCGPAHGPLVDVVQLATCAWAPALVTLAILKKSSCAESVPSSRYCTGV